MTKQLRSYIVNLLSRRIRTEGMLKLTELPRIFEEENVDRSLYASTGLKRWLKEQFPEFMVLGNNGREALRLIQDPLVRIYRILEEALDQNGQILLSAIPQRYFLPEGIHYQDYTMGKKLSEWLTAAFPEFAVSEDNLWLYLKGSQPPAPGSSPTQAPVQANLSPQALAEVQQMHKLAFMNWWSNNIRKLRSYNGELTGENQVKVVVAHQLGGLLLGNMGGFVDARQEAEPRVAFDTSLKSQHGTPIYGILMPNPQEANAKKRKWVLVDFACPEEDTPLGQWLREHRVMAKKPATSLSDLEEKLRQAEQERSHLLPMLQEYLDVLAQGCLPRKSISKEVKDWETQSDQLRQLFQQVWDLPYPEEQALQQVSQRVGDKAARLKAAVELFDTVAKQTADLFVQYRLPIQGVPTPEEDRQTIHRQYDNAGADLDLRLFEETLKPYCALRNVMEAVELSQKVEEQIDCVLCRHFSEISYRFAVRILMGAEQSEQAYLSQLDQIEEHLRACQTLVAAQRREETEWKGGPLSAQELLEACLRTDDGVDTLMLARGIFPQEVSRQMLVLGEIEPFQSYLKTHPEECENPSQQIKAAADPTLPRERTYWAAAQRLLQVEGNRGRLAECYFLLGLAFGEEKCCAALLRLYREAGDQMAFRAVCQHSDQEQEELDNQVFYLLLLCQHFPEEVPAYLKKHLPLLYCPESRQALQALPEGILSPEENRKKQALLEQPVPNLLEQAVIAGNDMEIRRLAADWEALRAMGYEEEACQRISQAANESVGTHETRDNYEIGLRLYRFQKNLHHLAERYMWRGIAQDQKIRAYQLMLLLAQEERWQECSALYESNPKHYEEDSRCRQPYLIARLRLDPVGAQKYVRECLQDCLWMMEAMPRVRTEIQAAVQSEEPEGGFYGQVLALEEKLCDPLVKSVVLQDRMLREFATDAYAQGQGVPETYARQIGEAYRADRYPRGMDALSVALRAYQMFGTYQGVAEAAARLVLPEMQGVEVLWNLYREEGNQELQFRLMQEYPMLQQEHMEFYCAMLFQREEYEAFLAQCPPEREEWDWQLQIFIAQQKLHPGTQYSLPPLPEFGTQQALDWFAQWGALLTATLVESGRLDDFKYVLIHGFCSWLDAFEESLLRDVVTGREGADTQLLEAVQQAALTQERPELALYLYQTLGVGQLSDLAERFYTQRMVQLETVPAGEKLRGLRQLQRLCGGCVAGDERILLLQIQLIQENPALSQEEEADEIRQVLAQYPPEEVQQLLPLLEDPQLFLCYPVYSVLAQLAEKMEDDQAVLRLFLRMIPFAQKQKDSDYQGFVCRLLGRAFARGAFPADALLETEKWCTQYVKQHQTADGLLCLYFVKMAQGEKGLASYLLRVLADQSTERVGEELGQILSEQLRGAWETNLPSYFDLFKDYLTVSTVDEMEGYIAFANLSTGTQELSRPQVLDTEWENRMLSESESIALVRFLYANPTQTNVWKWCTRLPLQDNPVSYAKLLFMACQHQAASWKECAEYCEKYEQWELLLQVYLAWVEAENIFACRIYLEDRLNANPDYFARWRGRKELLQLSNILCTQVKQSEMKYHPTIRATSLIAVKTGFPEAVTCLMERFEDVLLGDCRHLGVVLAVHLLLDGRYEEGAYLLGRLNNVLEDMAYREIVNLLAGKSAVELEEWMGDERNKILFHLILPDGNMPNLQQINAITYEGIQRGQIKETAHALSQALTIFPDDYGVYNALFDLCCMEFDGFLPLLHQSLRGLVRLQPNPNARPFYRRARQQYVRMLAVLDALVRANRLSRQIPDYDFSAGTEHFCRQTSAAALPYSELMEISQVGRQVQDALGNQRAEEKELLSLGYRSCITGNWFTLLRQAWEKRGDIRSALACQIDKVEDLGLVRSVLRLILEVAPEQREELILWLKTQLGMFGESRPKNMRQRQLQFVEVFVKEGHFAKLENQMEFGSLDSILNNPFEDYSFAALLQAKYVDVAIRKNSEHLFALSWLLGAMICHNGYQTELHKLADQQFAQGDDLRACSLYHAMYRLCLMFDMTKVSLRNGNRSFHRSRSRELCESRYRLTALFSGDRAMMARVGNADFHVWSCINLVLTLAYSVRSDEILRLCTYFSKENELLAKSLLRAMDPQKNDAEKRNAVDKLHNDVAKAYYCYVVKYPYNPNKANGAELCSHFLKDKDVADELNSRYLELAIALSAENNHTFSGLSPSHTILLENRPADSKISQQKDPLLWSAAHETVDMPEKEVLEQIPFFAEGEEPLQGSEDVGKLISEHQKLQNRSDTVETKEALSRTIYRLCLASDQYPRRDALLLLGSDCYYLALSRGDKETVGRVVLALAALQKHGWEPGYGSEEARKILPNGLYDLILSFPTLSALLHGYGEYRSLFHYLQSLLDDELLVACMGQIYTVLDNLRNCYALSARETPELLREELSINYLHLENIEANRWMNLKNKVQKLINDEINELDQRPVLQFTILSAGPQRPFGTLSGQVQNIGQAAAQNIEIQASYGDNSHSNRYVLPRLAPGRVAVFEVDYDCEAHVETLEYYLNATFSHNGKLCTSVVAKGELELRQLDSPEYPGDLLCRNPNGIAFQVDAETGEVFSPEFVGRRGEKAFLRSLLEEEFVSCRSALVYGIRRTGKSSLLNYLAAYIQARRPQILCVQTDCQNMRGTDPIQYVFVDRVLDEVELQRPEVMADSQWLQWKERWASPAYCADQEPERLSLFYRQLKNMRNIQGTYLILDEVDRLFQRVEENRQGEKHRNLEGLFGALSEMLNQVDCKQAVHFVLCGSNWMIRYNLKGEKINQLFQRFGKQVMEVGKLPEADMQEVIRRPYKPYPELQVTPEAMQWIWNYTGGLVWHTKMLAQEAISRAKRDCRCQIYPADVQQSIPYVVTEEWCKQFYEGCESGEEFRVIDAMQSLAANRNAYIHIERIRERLGHDMLEVQRTMITLESLKVVARHPVDQQLYCFGQDIYRRYFRTQPSQYPRVLDEPDIFQALQSAEQAVTVSQSLAVSEQHTQFHTPAQKIPNDLGGQEDYSGLFG